MDDVDLRIGDYRGQVDRLARPAAQWLFRGLGDLLGNGGGDRGSGDGLLKEGDAQSIEVAAPIGRTTDDDAANVGIESLFG